MRGRIALCLLILLLPGEVLAGGAGRLECGQDPDQPIYQLTRMDPKTFEMRAYFPGGTRLLPLYSGDVTVADLASLQRKSDFLQELGSRYTVSFPDEQCIRERSRDGLYYVHCFTKEPVQFNGIQLPSGLSFHVTGRKVLSLARVNGLQATHTDDETTVGVEIGIPVSDGTYWLDFARTFSNGECRINAAFWD